jgi:hypothetical protein
MRTTPAVMTARVDKMKETMRNQLNYSLSPFLFLPLSSLMQTHHRNMRLKNKLLG